MADQQGTTSHVTDDMDISRSIADVGERTRRMLIDWLTVNDELVSRSSLADPVGIASSFLELTAKMMIDPAQIVRAQQSLWNSFMDLWQNTALRLLGNSTQPVAQPDYDDRRFHDTSWKENDVFNYILQSYLLSSRWLRQTLHDVDSLDPRSLEIIDFYTRQFVNALSPSNFAVTNPEVVRATIESGGENLLNGLKNLLSDLTAIGFGTVPVTPYSLVPGENVATTPGKVVYRNDLMELIQYAPSTDTVVRQPLLFVPPWIHKYYLLDLDAGDSWVRWAVERGHTVFMISWVNPGKGEAHCGIEDYVLRGPIAALDAIRRSTGEEHVNTIGYCTGGTLLATALAYLAARGDDRVGSATFLATVLDYSEHGSLGSYINQATSTLFEEMMAEFGRVDTRLLATIVSMLSEHDLVWSFVVDHYLLGNDSFPYDLFRWNVDATRVPEALHRFYLRNVFEKNLLIAPGEIKIAGTGIDLRRVRVPAYFLAAREDHIAPWRSVFKGAQSWGGPTRFTLTGSGHIAGLINPPSADKYHHWTTRGRPSDHPEQWLAAADRRNGSWWPHWDRWVKRTSKNQKVSARTLDTGNQAVLGDAPGTYVRMTA
ncbi:MAG: class I poly(R)-hydroxyalkanoic acid synthase [Rhodospirillales bacterium]|nr:class I poly(R)-hydroxyalkanoic acid synthase [Rhodospirillales bacterium]